jgi:hypothetical protein
MGVRDHLEAIAPLPRPPSLSGADMFIRMAFWFPVVLFVACWPAEARNDADESRAAADHRACLSNGFRAGSAQYTECREQRQRAVRSEQDWWGWLTQDSVEFSCKFWGYKPGTAAFGKCVEDEKRKRARNNAEDEQKAKADADCLRSGSGTITFQSGNTFGVNCPGHTYVCPGDSNCPTCPGGIGCPTRPTCPGGVGCPN